MYNRKLEISIMKAVGATDWFVRWPFLVEGVALGVVSAFVSLILTYGIYSFAGQPIKDALGIKNLVPFREEILNITLIFLGIGLFAGVVGSLIILNKYLKKEGSEFRAL
jgi:cell division transport system permease protein